MLTEIFDEIFPEIFVFGFSSSFENVARVVNSVFKKRNLASWIGWSGLRGIESGMLAKWIIQGPRVIGVPASDLE